MDLKNGSVVTEFILVGFSVGWELQFVFLVTFSLIYGATVLGNVLIGDIQFHPSFSHVLPPWKPLLPGHVSLHSHHTQDDQRFAH